MKNKKTALVAILASLAIIFGYIENLFPLPIPVYGAKTGISNIVILSAIYMLDIKYAFLIMLIKTFCSSFLFATPVTFLYSFSGGLFSIFTMLFAKKTNRLSIIGTSILGGVFHNLGQLFCAGLLLSSMNTLYYLPLLSFCGIISGFIIGIITKTVLKKLGRI